MHERDGENPHCGARVATKKSPNFRMFRKDQPAAVCVPERSGGCHRGVLGLIRCRSYHSQSAEGGACSLVRHLGRLG
jgi:hypothetical protein